jgi:hypothetical protein
MDNHEIPKDLTTHQTALVNPNLAMILQASKMTTAVLMLELMQELKCRYW